MARFTGTRGYNRMPPEKVTEYEDQHSMPYITSIERLGRQEGRQEAIIQLLEIRFNRVPPGLLETIREVTETNHLDRLFKTAATCPDIEAFTAAL
jgi:hypothetical protein